MEMRISDEEWAFVCPHLSPPPKKKSWNGRPRAPDRRIFEAILYILVSGSRWQDLPHIYPAKSTCHRRFQTWSRDGSLLKVHQALVRRLLKDKKIDLSESFTDTTFIKEKKGPSGLYGAQGKRH